MACALKASACFHFPFSLPTRPAGGMAPPLLPALKPFFGRRSWIRGAFDEVVAAPACGAGRLDPSGSWLLDAGPLSGETGMVRGDVDGVDGLLCGDDDAETRAAGCMLTCNGDTLPWRSAATA